MKISVIIPIYNKEKYLIECLNSVIDQSFNDLEIICVNDGSTDNSVKILEEYSKKDNRIIIKNQENKGPGHARNEGLKLAKGEYVIFLDADDWLELDSIEKLYHNAKSNDSELVLFNAIEHLPEEKYRKRIYYSEDIECSFDYHKKKDIVMNNFLIVCTKLHKLDFIKDNDIRFAEEGLFEDVFFHIKSIIKAKRITYVNEIFYNYRRTDINTRQSESVQSNKNMEFYKILSDIKIFLEDEKVYDELEENYLNFKLTELKNLFNSNKNEEFYNLLKNDFECNEFDENILKNLSSDKQEFYRSIIESKDYMNYLEVTTPKKVKNLSYSTRIKNCFRKIF